MKFTVLGKYGAFPARNGALSSYLVETESSKILLDCGSGALSRLQNYCKIEDLTAIVLTHLHSDHISDMFPLRYYLERIEKRIPIFLPLVKGLEYDLLSECGQFIFNPIMERIPSRLGDDVLKFYRMDHNTESYAVRIEADGKTFVYSGDTRFNDNIAASIQGADAYLCDCAVPTTMHKEDMQHMSVAEGVAVTKPDNIRLYVTHQFPGQSPRIELRERYDNALLVKERTTYQV